MAGLETILQKIALEGQQEAQDVLHDAQAQADAFIAQAQADAVQILQTAQQEADQQAQQLLERGHSASQLSFRQGVLAKKQQLIQQALLEAKEALLHQPAQSYFRFCLALVVKCAQEGQKGTVAFCARDLARLPEDWENQMSEALQKKYAALSVDPVAVHIEGGCILRYGGVEENCSVEALFIAEAEKLRDRLQVLLFS